MLRGGGVQIRLSFFSVLYGTPAPSSESQLLEAWPVSIYGHLREGYLSVPCELMYWPILSKLASRCCPDLQVAKAKLKLSDCIELGLSSKL